MKHILQDVFKICILELRDTGPKPTLLMLLNPHDTSEPSTSPTTGRSFLYYTGSSLSYRQVYILARFEVKPHATVFSTLTLLGKLHLLLVQPLRDRIPTF